MANKIGLKKDDSDFQKIFEKFQPRILSYLTRLVGRDEAEDLTQEVFIKVNSELNNFRKEAELSTWIYKIATNKMIDKLRQFKTQKFLANNQKLSDLFEEVTGDNNKFLEDKKSQSLLGKIIKKDMNQCIRNVINKLPKKYSAILILKDLEGFKNQEIAEIMKLSLATIKMRLHRARVELKEALKKQCNLYHDENNNLSCEQKT